MIAALACSVLFLTSYLIYHAQVGSKPLPGHRRRCARVYFTILLTHTVLAAAVPVPRRSSPSGGPAASADAQHVRIARWTLPIWLYVSVTGVVVYWMLYRMSW